MTWLDTNDRCRVCAHLPSQKIRLIQVFSVEGVQRNLKPKLYHCFKINVTRQDQLPTSICELCISRLDTYFNLVKDYFNGQNYLQELHRSTQQIRIMIRQTEIKTEPIEENPVDKIEYMDIKTEPEENDLPSRIPEILSTETSTTVLLQTRGNETSSNASSTSEERNLPSTSSGIARKVLKKTKIIECEYCDKTFTHRGDFNKHLRKHTGEQPYSCDVCNKKFAHTSNLNRHKLVHSGELPFECEKCHKKFNRKDKLAAHKRCRNILNQTVT